MIRFRPHSTPRFRGDRSSLFDKLLLLGLALVALMVAFDAVSWRVFALLHSIISSLP